MSVLVGVILVYKSGFTFFLTVKTKKLVCTLYMLYTWLFYIFEYFESSFYNSYRQVPNKKIRQNFTKNWMGMVPCSLKMFVTYSTICVFHFSITSSNFELQTSALHKNGVEFHQAFTGQGHRYVTHVCQVLNTSFIFLEATVF